MCHQFTIPRDRSFKTSLQWIDVGSNDGSVSPGDTGVAVADGGRGVSVGSSGRSVFASGTVRDAVGVVVGAPIMTSVALEVGAV